MTLNKRAIRIGLFLSALTLLIVVAAVSQDPRIARRRQVLLWKSSGVIPYVSWPEVMRAMLPGSWRNTSSQPASSARVAALGEEPCPVLWATSLGTFWGQRTDNITLEDLGHLDRYQSGPVTIRGGDVVIDVGSHIGTFTRFALQKGAKLVVAFEPDPGSNACFKRTFEKEIAEGRVILMEAALWETSGTLKFSVASRSDAGAVTSEFDPQWGATRIVEVPAISLDDAVARLNLPRVDFIKLAIGNATVHALRGARQTLPRFRPRMVVVISISPEDPLVFPKVALEVLPTYHAFTRELEMAYFY